MNALSDRLLETRRSLARRIVAHIRQGTSDLAEAPMRNAVSVYTDPARHATERQRLFRETPVVACLSRDLPEPGSFRTFDETGVPIVVTRDPAGTLRAFLNMCTHRGARLVREERGTARLMTCWFHGWSFDLTGALRGTPEKERFAGCLSDRDHLVAVPAEERHGLVFVVATPGATLDLDRHLGAFGAELADLELDQAEPVKAEPLTVAANWKYALDTYGEGYHFAALHKQTLAPYFRNDITVYDRFGPHHRVLFVSREMERWLNEPESAWGLDKLGAVHYLFPNTIIFVGAVRPGRHYYTVFRHFPAEEVGRTTTYKAIYAPRGVELDEHRREVEEAFDATANVVRSEDYVVAAEGWRNLSFMPEGSSVLYGRQEIALQFQHRAIASAINMPLPLDAAAAEAAE